MELAVRIGLGESTAGLLLRIILYIHRIAYVLVTVIHFAITLAPILLQANPVQTQANIVCVEANVRTAGDRCKASCQFSHHRAELLQRHANAVEPVLTQTAIRCWNCAFGLHARGPTFC